MEFDLLQFAVNSGTGVLFGVLMWRMCCDHIDKNTDAIQKLTEWLQKR